MKFVMIMPFGGLPISSPDLGYWYPRVAHTTKISIINLNYEFWLHIVSEECMSLLLREKSKEKNLNVSIQLRLRAEQALDNLKKSDTYSSINDYSQSIESIENYLNFINNSQSELSFSIVYGLRINQIDYNYSTSIYEYVNSFSLLDKVLYDYFDKNDIEADVLLLKVRTQYELVFTIVLCKIMRELRKNIKICLVGHEYENFILSKLGFDNVLLRNTFDIVILKRNELVLPILIEALKAHQSIPYIIDDEYINEIKRNTEVILGEQFEKSIYVPRLKSFFPEYAVSTRLSTRPCYWNKCSFCNQNNKIGLTDYNDDRGERYEHIGLMYKIGYRNFVFMDEALSKAELMDFSKWIMEQKVNIVWLFRTRLDCEFDDELIGVLVESGCKSIGFGIETINELTLKSMNKYKHTLSLDYINNLFQKFIQNNIMIHLNLIIGYPGESISDMEKTIGYVKSLLKQSFLFTFTLNKFTLFKDTKVYNNPKEYGIEITQTAGDFTSIQPYRIKDRDYSDEEFTNFIFQSHKKLWENQDCSSAIIGAKFLYNNTLHGIYLRLTK